MAKVIEFTEEKFLEEYAKRFKMNCNALLLKPTKENYLELIHPYILTADNLFYMHFISHEAWLVCRDLYLDVTERIKDRFLEWDISPVYERRNDGLK